jgi:hypothetical protein
VIFLAWTVCETTCLFHEFAKVSYCLLILLPGPDVLLLHLVVGLGRSDDGCFAGFDLLEIGFDGRSTELKLEVGG